MRASTVIDLKVYFTSLYRNYLKCKIIDTKTNKSSVANIGAIFATKEDHKNTVLEFTHRMTTRNSSIEKFRVYKGSQVLHSSIGRLCWGYRSRLQP